MKKKIKKQKCWGIFLRNNKNFSGINRSPLVYCDTKETAEKMMNNIEYIHFDPKYNTKKCVIREIRKEVPIVP